MSDEDWFERALREESAPDEDEESPSDVDEENATDADRDDERAESEQTAAEEPSSDESFDDDLEPVEDDGFDDDIDPETDPFGGVSEEGDEADEGDDGDGLSELLGEGADATGGGFGGLDGNGDLPTSGGDPATGAADADAVGAEADPFGGVSDAPAGTGSETDAGDDPFGEDFAAAMGSAPGGPDEEFGGGGFGGAFGGGGGGPSFDEEEFDSDIDRIDVGIEGLDEMILGGVPERSLLAVIGSAGTGKTTFGLQFLNEALTDGGNAVYITLEESEEAILSTAEEKGWEYRRYNDEGRLAVVAMDPIEMANSLDSIRDDISRLVTEFGADRLVLDSVSLLEMMYDHPSKRRSEVFDFARSLKEAGVTTMLTSEANEDNAYASRHGIVEYLTDAVFILQYVRPSDFRETRLAVEIQKIRDANHSRETKPYEITNDGISVYRQANIF
ncbi:KaiC domain-containing protein [Halobaculum marinum]|uniref:KaiC domain-containing protein n=1 Tax=Halobaculum marinum TaxID=3031996 RepID=A0ABD5WX74_9EURY|nr:KaiC domain-containing protein [Halobaculum sp. DT55]